MIVGDMLARLLADEIAGCGPISFARFMELALTHPEHGYYTRPQDPFGARGDFYTAAQLQPVFGRLIGQATAPLLAACGPPPQTVLDLGAGRQEMAAAFEGHRYVAVDAVNGTLPEPFTGLIFANEFFDALPVHVLVRRGSQWREQCVTVAGSRFVWVERGAETDLADKASRLAPQAGEGEVVEVRPAAGAWLGRLAATLTRGHLLVIDYGYTAAERRRFPQGTIMSYRRHAALADVLAEPGNRDLTAHVDFTALSEEAARCGWHVTPVESLRALLLRAGEADRFAVALRAGTAAEEVRLRLQLKTLLFSLGESFRVLLLERR